MRHASMSISSFKPEYIAAFLVLGLFVTGCGSGSSANKTTPPPPTQSAPPPGMGSGGSGGTAGGSSGGGTGSVGGTGSSGGGAAPTQAQFLYGTTGGSVRGGKIDTSTGQVMSVAMPTDPATGDTGFQSGSGGFAFAVATDRLGRFLYTADRQKFSAGVAAGNNAIGAFTIDRTSGVLTRVSGSPYMLPAVPQDIVIDGGGRFVYVSLPGTIDIWSVNQSSGALTHLSSTAGGGAQLASTWDGRFLLSNAGDSITSYSIDQTNGSLTPVNTVAVGKSDGFSLSIGNAVAVSWTGNTATVLSLDSTGKLTMNGNPVVLQGGSRTHYISIASDNRKSYVSILDEANGMGHLVRYDGIGGDQLGIFGTSVTHAEADFNGKFVYTANGASQIQTYVFNANGAFGPGPVSQGPIGMVQSFRLSP